MGTEGHKWLQFVELRYSNPVSELWFLANVLHPKYVGKSLSQSELRDAKEVMMNEYPDLIANFIEFNGSWKESYNSAFETISSCSISSFVRAQIATDCRLRDARTVWFAGFYHYRLHLQDLKGYFRPSGLSTLMSETDSGMKKQQSWPL